MTNILEKMPISKSNMCIIIILIGILWYTYKIQNSVTVYFFQRPDCTYCNKMKDEWNEVTKSLRFSGISIKNIDINNPKHSKLHDNFEVKSVPHVVKLYPNGIRDIYNGDRNKYDILKWIYDT